jgi:hypothetical protein
MQRENFIAAINAVAVYDDPVLMEAQQFALAAIQGTADYNSAPLSESIAEDLAPTGEEHCWQHKELLTAIAQYEDEQLWDAARTAMHAMLNRSYAYEQAFC